MKLHSDNHGFESNLPDNRIKFQLKSSAKLFGILSDGLYRDKILAVIREYCCNAYDAHVTAGKSDVPFKVRLPNRFEPTFAVIDEGSGIDPDKIGEIFWTYGESSKTDDNTTIGALGLGSKSAFAYTKSSFIVKNRWNGTEHVYFCFINENGEPEGSMVNQDVYSPMTNGITVEFAVRPEDNSAFYSRFAKIFKHWSSVKPEVLGVDAGTIFHPDPVKVIEGKDWYLEKNSDTSTRHKAMAIMGNVQYPIEAESIPHLPDDLKIIATNSFVITFPLGALEFAASREDLSYSEFTCKVLIDKLAEVQTEIQTSFYNKVFVTSKDHLSFYKNFKKTFAEFRSMVAVSGDLQGNERDNAYSEILLGKSKDDEVEYLGTSFVIEGLTVGLYSRMVQHHQPFGFYAAKTRGRKDRYFLKSASILKAITNQEVSSDIFHDDNVASYKISENQAVFTDDWRPAYKPKHKDKLSVIDNVMLNLSLINLETTNFFYIEPKASLSFIVNDVGSSGKDRFKALNVASTTVPAINGHQLVYVDFNAKAISAAGVMSELQDLISSTLTGAKIILMSTLPDVRPPVVKEKVERGSIKLTFKTFEVKKSASFIVSGPNALDLVLTDIEVLNHNVSTVMRTIPIGDLIDHPVVPYVIKARTKHYDDVSCQKHHRLDDHELLSLATHLKLFDDCFVEVDTFWQQKIAQADDSVKVELIQRKLKTLPVLAITKNEHTKLAKHGVKLVSLTKLIGDKIEAMNKVEQFTETSRRLITLLNVQLLSGFYGGIPANVLKDKQAFVGWEASASLFKQLFTEYMELHEGKADVATIFAKLYVLTATVGYANVSSHTAATHKINNELDTRYPLLSMTGFHGMHNSTKLSKLITYIEQVDTLLERSIESAKQEVEELA